MNTIHMILLERFKGWPKSPYHFTISSKVSFPDLSMESSIQGMVLVHECLPNGKFHIGGETRLSILDNILDLLEKEANCG